MASRKPTLYVGPLTKILLVLLRVAIGWHLCYEGLCKLDPQWLSLMRGKEPKAGAAGFSAEGYLRASTGPLRRQFRGMIPDVAGVRMLDAEGFRSRLAEDLIELDDRYVLSVDQRKLAEAKLEELVARASEHLAAAKTAATIADYRRDLERWDAADRKDWLGKDAQLRKEWEALESTRRMLNGPLDGWRKEFQQGVLAGLSTGQANRPKPLSAAGFWRMSKLDQSNLVTAWGLTVCGALMIVGLFTRLAALGAAGFLALFYLSLPPWPGLPAVPGTEGNYLVVNKNLVEMLACLVLATLPTGAWGGLDALLRGLLLRPLLGFGAREERLEQRLRDEG